MEAVIIDVDPNGEVQVSVKPKYWMPVAEQQQRLRKIGSKQPAEFLLSTDNVAGTKSKQSRPEWRAEHALALGSCETNGLGPRTTSELSWAQVLASQQSVHNAVDQLNRGSLSCQGNVCVVYSKSSNCHYLLYKEGKGADSVRCESLEQKVADLKRQLDFTTQENHSLQEELSMARSDLGKVRSLEAKLAAQNHELREHENGAASVLHDRIMVLENALAEERQRNMDLERQINLASQQSASSASDAARIASLEAELAAERKRCQELDRANLLLLEQQGGSSSKVGRVGVVSASYSTVAVHPQPDLFDQLDTNHDGVLDASEIARLRPVQLGQPVTIQASIPAAQGAPAGAPRVIGGGLASLGGNAGDAAGNSPHAAGADRIDMTAFTGSAPVRKLT